MRWNRAASPAGKPVLGSLAAHAALFAALAGAAGWQAVRGGGQERPAIAVLPPRIAPRATSATASEAPTLLPPEIEAPLVREVAAVELEPLLVREPLKPPIRELAWLEAVLEPRRAPQPEEVPAPVSPPPASAEAAEADAPAAPSLQPPRVSFAGCPAPAYPRRALRLEQEGRVILLLRVGADGRVTEARVSESSGHALLDEAALAAARAWILEPARRGDEAVAGSLRVPIRFRLRDSS
jgi:protein TonB